MSIATEETTDISVDVETIVAPFEDDGTHGENFAHIVNPPNNLHIWTPGMTSRDVVNIARSEGLKVKALCGKEWVPKRNPELHPACKTCMDIAMELMAGAGE